MRPLSLVASLGLHAAFLLWLIMGKNMPADELPVLVHLVPEAEARSGKSVKSAPSLSRLRLAAAAKAKAKAAPAKSPKAAVSRINGPASEAAPQKSGNSNPPDASSDPKKPASFPANPEPAPEEFGAKSRALATGKTVAGRSPSELPKLASGGAGPGADGPRGNADRGTGADPDSDASEVIPINSQHPKYRAFLSEIWAAIDRNWHDLPGRASNGRTVVELTISKSGILLDFRVVKSSGERDLDERALAAVRSSAPFPAIPDYIRGRRNLLLRMAFNYMYMND